MHQTDFAPAAAPMSDSDAESRYIRYYHELDAWTEYWDVYHPESQGRYYFGNGASERGLLTDLVPREGPTAIFTAWARAALQLDSDVQGFVVAARLPQVACAVMEVDALLSRLFHDHFGAADDPSVRADYLNGMVYFATDTLPPAAERDKRIPGDDPRKRTAGRHTLDGDVMWFVWAMQVQAAQVIVGVDREHARRCLSLAAIAMGCSLNFAWREHRRTRCAYRADSATTALLRERGANWAGDFNSAADEVHALYRIRETGVED